MMDLIRGALASPADWVVRWIQGWDWGDGREEKRITTERALTYAPIWYGVNRIAGHVAQLPVHVYRRLERGSERDRTHNIHQLMRRPNAYQTSIVFREQVAMNSLMDGNGRAAIVRRGNRITELIPLLPDRTTTVMINGEKVHGTRPPADDRVRLFFNNIEGDKSEDGLILLDDDNVLHIPGLSMNGVSGVALRDIASRNLNTSINVERRLSSQMEKGFSGNLILEAPTGVFRNEKDAEEFLKAFEARHNAPDKAGKPGMLREGIKANILSMNNKDAEMLENRKFQRQDAALYLGLESILGDDSSVSYNSLEQKNLAYLMNCLNRWLKRWEEEMEYKLLPTRQFKADSHYIRFNTAALLKSDFRSTVESLSSLVTSTIYSRNEAREVLDKNPVDGGDVHENPAITVGNQESQPQPEDEEDPEPGDDVAMMAHISHMIQVEANRVRAAAAKHKNFLQWVDGFYSKKFEQGFADHLEMLGLDRDLATVHCEESKRQLLEICANSPVESVAEKVAARTKTWKARASIILSKELANV